MGQITVPDESWREDDGHERDVQREIDDAAEVKRRASGFSPEQLALQEAFIEGSRAGSMRLSPSLNPYPDGVPGHAEWLRGWHSAASRRSA